MGGGASLLRDLLAALPLVRPQWEWLVFLLPRDRRDFDDPPPRDRLRIEAVSIGDSALGRLWWLYRELPGWLESSRASGVLAFANVASPLCPVPQVVYIHQLLAFHTDPRGAPFSFRAFKLRLARGLILRGALRAASVIVQTQHMRSRLESVAAELTGRVHVIPGCASSIRLSDEIRPEKRRLIDGCSWPRLAYVAHPAYHKNHANLIRALPKIVERYPNVTLLLTMETDGHNPMVDTGCVSKIRRLVEEIGVGGHVAWLGTLSQQEVRYLLRQTSVAVFPSFEESFGIPLAEVIAECCPLAASDLPFARDVAGPAAVYFDPQNPHSIAACVTDVLARPEMIESLKREATVRRTLFEPKNVAEQIAAVIEGAVHSSKIDHSHANPGAR